MGMLDEAIREHLELRRTRGADPGEVARKEQEALGPISSAQAATPEGYPPVAGGITPAGIAPEEDLPIVSASRGSDPSRVDQETAEFDMRTVLGDEHLAHAAPATSPGAENPLEWEIPNDRLGGLGERNGDPWGYEHDGGGIVAGRDPEAGTIEPIEHRSEEPPSWPARQSRNAYG
jgi:hypothetical protein